MQKATTLNDGSNCAQVNDKVIYTVFTGGSLWGFGNNKRYRFG